MLTLNNLTVSFHGQRVLNGISFRVDSGETIGIIGPNGSGKTTLFNCISGFAPCDTGSITYCDEPIHLLPPHQRARRGLGRVFQNFGIFREMTLVDNIVLALEAHGDESVSLFPWTRKAKRIRENAIDFLRAIHLEHKAFQRASSLSGGQMRLLEIVRTLAGGADIFLLDEPTAGVSPRMKEDVGNFIRQLQELGKTVLIIEHDINFIQRFCNRIIVLNEGLVVLDDSPENVRNDERLQEIYFGSEASTA